MKNKICLAAAAALIAFASCSKSEDSSSSVQVRTYSLVTAIDGTEEPMITPSTYSYDMFVGASTVTIGVNNIKTGSGNVSFTTDAFKFTPVTVSYQGTYGAVFVGSTENAGTTKDGQSITDLVYEITPLMYVSPEVSYKKNSSSSLPQPDLSFIPPYMATYMHYTIGDKYLVRTFWNDETFRGTTKTYVDNDPATEYKNTSVLYRVKMNHETMKATAMLYNVKLNESMPLQEILILENLDLKFTSSGWTIEGENIIPLYIENEEIMENPQFPFTKFTISSDGKLVNATCSYEVAGRFQGKFEGKYLDLVSQSNSGKAEDEN